MEECRFEGDPTGCAFRSVLTAFTAPFPVYFLQTPKVIGALFEYQRPGGCFM
jgi:hypothetical protein